MGAAPSCSSEFGGFEAYGAFPAGAGVSRACASRTRRRCIPRALSSTQPHSSSRSGSGRSAMNRSQQQQPISWKKPDFKRVRTSYRRDRGSSSTRKDELPWDFRQHWRWQQWWSGWRRRWRSWGRRPKLRTRIWWREARKVRGRYTTIPQHPIPRVTMQVWPRS